MVLAATFSPKTYVFVKTIYRGTMILRKQGRLLGFRKEVNGILRKFNPEHGMNQTDYVDVTIT